MGQRGATRAPDGTWPRSTSGLCLGPTWRPWVASGSPLRVYHPSDLKTLGDASKKYSAAATGAETTEREKLSGREKSVGVIPSRRWEIVAIVTGFIGVIINIILTDSTITSTAPLHSAIASRVILVVVHWDHFSGVDCLVQLMLLSFIGEILL